MAAQSAKLPKEFLDMKALHLLAIPGILLILANAGSAQCANDGSKCVPQVPHLVRFNGSLKNTDGSPRTDIIGVTFAVYGEPTGGVPLWQETQNVELDRQGRYVVLLGATTADGMPKDLFSSGGPRWLGVLAHLPGETEQPRVLFVSAPYAIEAADAQTLGGLPASAFAKVAPNEAGQNTTGLTVVPAHDAAQTLASAGVVAGTASQPVTGQNVTTLGGTVNLIPKFSGITSIVNSQIKDSAGVVSMRNLSNILFADRFAGGVADAVAACPAAGCIIYALSPGGNLNLGTIDPGSKAVTIYLGPFTYNVTQITVRSGLKIIGMGSAPDGTVLQSVNGNNPVFVLPQANNLAAESVVLTGFRLIGSTGNTSEDAFFFDVSSLTNAGLWYSTISDIYIMNFAGIGIHVKGPNNFGALVQWVTFNNIVVIRTQNGKNGIRIEGGAFELYFTDCEVDGYAPGGQPQAGSGTNIYLGGIAGGVNGYPLDISFQGLVSQAAATAVQLDGGSGISFYHSHHEILWGGYLITGNTNIGTWGVTISDATFMGNVGVNQGSGYLLNVATTFARGIRFVHNIIGSNADSVVTGINLSQIVYRDNLYLGSSAVPPTSGITTQLLPAASLNIGSAHSVGLYVSTTPISTIQSTLGPGETVTFFTLGGVSTFAAGGNINLMGKPSVTVTGSMTFVRTDGTGALSWTPVAQWP
jgi:hypothetical protein